MNVDGGKERVLILSGNIGERGERVEKCFLPTYGISPKLDQAPGERRGNEETEATYDKKVLPPKQEACTEK